MNRGGKREGAGRKPGTVKKDKKEPYSTRLAPDIKKWLQSQNRTAAQKIEYALRKVFKI